MLDFKVLRLTFLAESLLPLLREMLFHYHCVLLLIIGLFLAVNDANLPHFQAIRLKLRCLFG